MWYECNECGHFEVTDRPPAVCACCGLAQATEIDLARLALPYPPDRPLRELWFLAGSQRVAHEGLAEPALA